MRVEFLLEKKKGNIKDKETGEERQIEYYVLRRNLVNGDVIEVPIKGDKAKLLSLSVAIEKKNR